MCVCIFRPDPSYKRPYFGTTFFAARRLRLLVAVWHLVQFMDGWVDESNTSVRATQQQVT